MKSFKDFFRKEKAPTTKETVKVGQLPRSLQSEARKLLSKGRTVYFEIDEEYLATWEEIRNKKFPNLDDFVMKTSNFATVIK